MSNPKSKPYRYEFGPLVGQVAKNAVIIFKNGHWKHPFSWQVTNANGQVMIESDQFFTRSTDAKRSLIAACKGIINNVVTTTVVSKQATSMNVKMILIYYDFEFARNHQQRVGLGM